MSANATEIWAVVPAYNEGPVISEVVTRILEVCHRVVLVDDGSRDETPALAAAAGAIVLRHPINLGQGAALQTGIEYALARGAALIATIDADGQHDPDDLRRMQQRLAEESADIALGSRFLGTATRIPRLRKLMLRLAVLFSNWTTRVSLTDAHNGLRLLTADAARQIDISQDRMAHASDIISQIGAKRLRYVEVPVTISYSEYSLNKGQKVSGAFTILSDLFIGWLSR